MLTTLTLCAVFGLFCSFAFIRNKFINGYADIHIRANTPQHSDKRLKGPKNLYMNLYAYVCVCVRRASELEKLTATTKSVNNDRFWLLLNRTIHAK